MSKPIRVAVTGAAGQIGYSLLFRIASGAMFGPDQKVALNLIEIEPGMKALEGVVMELDDCAFPLLQGVVPTANLDEGFRGVNWALLVGSVPRKDGMERKDLLGINGKIFTGQGQAIAKNAASDVRILVVGNPCNTNCLIAMNNGPRRAERPLVCHDPPRRKPRQVATGAQGRRPCQRGIEHDDLGQPFGDPISRFLQCPHRRRSRHRGDQRRCLAQGAFIETVQKRGAAIIEARGSSSAASAANAVVDTVRGLTTATPAGDWNSVCVCSDGSYGIDKGLIASFPIRSTGGAWEIVQGVPVNEFSRGKIEATVQELREEREAVSDLLPAVS